MISRVNNDVLGGVDHPNVTSLLTLINIGPPYLSGHIDNNRESLPTFVYI